MSELSCSLAVDSVNKIVLLNACFSCSSEFSNISDHVSNHDSVTTVGQRASVHFYSDQSEAEPFQS